MVWSFLTSGFEDCGTTEAIVANTPRHLVLSEGNSDKPKPVPFARECDYDENCTPLYLYIEKQEWSAVMDFLVTGYWAGSFFASGLPPEEQARTWVTRFDPKNKEELRWSQLPLHLAVILKAPDKLLQRLLDLYPESARCTDDRHMLPLHLAMLHGSAETTLVILLEAYPEAVNARGRDSKTPVDFALQGPHKMRGRVLQLFVEKSKAKAHMISNKELMAVRLKLSQREEELESTRSRLETTMAENVTLQSQLTKTTKQLEDLERSHGENEDNFYKRQEASLTAHKKQVSDALLRIEELQDERDSLLRGQEIYQQEERRLRFELAEAMEKSNSKVTTEMENLKAQLADEMKKSGGDTLQELRALQRIVEELKSSGQLAQNNAAASSSPPSPPPPPPPPSNKPAQSTDEVDFLRNQVTELRKKLQEAEEQGAASNRDDDMLTVKKSNLSRTNGYHRQIVLPTKILTGVGFTTQPAARVPYNPTV